MVLKQKIKYTRHALHWSIYAAVMEYGMEHITMNTIQRWEETGSSRKAGDNGQRDRESMAFYAAWLFDKAKEKGITIADDNDKQARPRTIDELKTWHPFELGEKVTIKNRTPKHIFNDEMENNIDCIVWGIYPTFLLLKRKDGTFTTILKANLITGDSLLVRR